MKAPIITSIFSFFVESGFMWVYLFVDEVDNPSNNDGKLLTRRNYGAIRQVYMPDGHFEPRVSEKRMEWDDFGRLRSVDENGFISVYLYNDGFDRRVKLLGALTALSYDGDSASVGHSLSSFMLFPDASTVYNNDVKITRHIYAGSELILSSVFNVDNAMGANQADNALRNGVRLASLEDSIATLYARHNLPFRRPDFAA